jgi:hypothetical protein
MAAAANGPNAMPIHGFVDKKECSGFRFALTAMQMISPAARHFSGIAPAFHHRCVFHFKRVMRECPATIGANARTLFLRTTSSSKK